MSIVIERAYRVDTAQPMARHKLRDTVQTGDRYAHRVTVELTREGAPMTGIAQAHGYLRRADGATVVMQGTVSGSMVSVLLPPACYDVPGPAQLVIRAERGNTVVTALWLDMLVSGGAEDGVVDPEQVLPTLGQLLAQIGRMESASAEVETALTALSPFTAMVHLPLGWVMSTRIDYQSGLPLEDTNYCATLPIAVAGGVVGQVDVYTACASDSSALAFYDEDGDPIFFYNIHDGEGLTLAHHLVSVPENARSMRFSCRVKNNLYQGACAAIQTPLSEMLSSVMDSAVSQRELNALRSAVFAGGWQEMTELSGFVKLPGCYAHSNGTLTPDAGFDTWLLTVPETMRLYAAPEQRPYDKYLSVALYDGTAGMANFLMRRRGYKEEDTLPTYASPLRVKRGLTLAVSVHAGEGFALMVDSALAHMTLQSGVMLGGSQLAQARGEVAEDLRRLDERGTLLENRLIRPDGYHLLTKLSARWERLPGQYVDGAGVLVEHEEYDTYARVTGAPGGLYATRPEPQDYLSIAVYDGVMDSDHFEQRLRSYRAENTLPAPDAPMALGAGKLIAVSVKAGGDFRLYMNDQTAAETLHPGVVLDEAQLDQVDAAARRNGWLFPLESTETELTFDLPTDKANVTLRYRLERMVNEAKHLDCWGLRGVKAMRGEQTLYPVVSEGNWELALMLTDRPDFIGGRQHGSEITSSFSFRVDGKPWQCRPGAQWCRELAMEERSILYDPLDETTQVAWHVKEYVITAAGIVIRQKVEWLRDAQCGYSYVCMLPIVRGADAVTPYRVTQWCRDNVDFVDYDISKAGFAGRPHQKKRGVTRYVLWSDETGVSAEVECRMENAPADSVSFVQNTADQYNKVYFSYCGEAYAAHAGEVWQWEQRYRLNVRAMVQDPLGGALRLEKQLERLKAEGHPLPGTEIFRTYSRPFAAFELRNGHPLLPLGFPVRYDDPTDEDVFVVGQSRVGAARIVAL